MEVPRPLPTWDHPRTIFRDSDNYSDLFRLGKVPTNSMSRMALYIEGMLECRDLH
jgi:hypothetical protein